MIAELRDNLLSEYTNLRRCAENEGRLLRVRATVESLGIQIDDFFELEREFNYQLLCQAKPLPNLESDEDIFHSYADLPKTQIPERTIKLGEALIARNPDGSYVHDSTKIQLAENLWPEDCPKEDDPMLRSKKIQLTNRVTRGQSLLRTNLTYAISGGNSPVNAALEKFILFHQTAPGHQNESLEDLVREVSRKIGGLRNRPRRVRKI